MTTNKTFFLVIIIFVLVPLFFAFLNYYYANLDKFSWGYDHVNAVSISALLIGAVASLWIFISNFMKKINNKYWYIVSAILFIVLSTYLYIVYSLSHFGF